MPQRFLRPGITNSERWNSVDFACQSFYVRILTLVDDFGQYDARPAVLWGQCFQIWNSTNPSKAIELQQVAVMLQQLAASRLIGIYQSEDGKIFLQVSQWQERIREGCRRKWPDSEKLQQVAASCSILLPSSPPPAPAPAPSPPPAPSPAAAGNGNLSKDEIMEDSHGRHVPWEKAESWLEQSKKDGSDYERSETRSAYLALEASGWAWGRNLVVDWRSALERQIQTDRNRGNGKTRGKPPTFAQINALKEEISKSPANRESLSKVSNPTPDQIQRLKEMRAKLSALNAEVANA